MICRFYAFASRRWAGHVFWSLVLRCWILLGGAKEVGQQKRGFLLQGARCVPANREIAACTAVLSPAVYVIDERWVTSPAVCFFSPLLPFLTVARFFFFLLFSERGHVCT